jgi:hypothetical protein
MSDRAEFNSVTNNYIKLQQYQIKIPSPFDFDVLGLGCRNDEQRDGMAKIASIYCKNPPLSVCENMFFFHGAPFVNHSLVAFTVKRKTILRKDLRC